MNAQALSASTPALTPLLGLLERQWHHLSPSALPLELWRKVLLGPVEDILARPGKAFRSHLVEAAWSLIAPEREAPKELGAVLEVLHAGSMVVDDIEDNSSTRRGAPALHATYGLPVALNAANWMYFWPFEIVRSIQLPPAVEGFLMARMVTTLCDCHRGQALDVALFIGDVEQGQVPAVVAETTSLKTGALMGLAASMGAAAAGATANQLAALETFGRRLGIALQKLDDLGNLSGNKDPAKRHEDLKNGRLTWPWAWAAEALDCASFSKLTSVATEIRAAAASANAAGDALGDGRDKGLSDGFNWLAARLKAVAGPECRQKVAAEVMVALGDLEGMFGRNATTAFLRNEISRLEASYG